ncbi:LysM peptidoglycan-binding domain-containing protein [Euzebya sp.]|uniref:LysM peptidoglycan-binding domain-containing protein n=1 Tax=Euzebya sp. TaxID=1971409 RepID=UPI003513109F
MTVNRYVRPEPARSGWAIIQTDPPPRRTLWLDHKPHTLRRGGVGGWRSRTVDRGLDVVEFGSTPRHTMRLELLFDAVGTPRDDVQAQLELLHLFGRKINQADPESTPPLVALTFGRSQQLRWVIDDIDPVRQVEHPATGRIMQAVVHVDLSEARLPTLAFTDTTPVEEAHATTGPARPFTRPDDTAGDGGFPTSYTVQPGDTLIGIATRLYGDWRRFEDIYQANRPPLVDRDLIPAGLVLTLPAP